MAEKYNSKQLVHEVGGGRAAFNLHGPNWLDTNCDLNIIDNNPKVLALHQANMRESMRQAYETGQLTFRRLGELATRPDIIDITTASGHHVEAIHKTLEELAARGEKGSDLTWLIEKPAVSSDAEMQQMLDLFKAGDLDIDRTFINGHYAASHTLARACEIIASETKDGKNPVQYVDVVFNKNRVPDVNEGRFTDPQLRAYGIEMPHQLTIGYTLAGVKPVDGLPEIIENKHYEQALDVPNSQGNFTAIRAKNGVVIRMAQGLGPYTMHANGAIYPRDDQPVERYAEVIFNDKRRVRLDLSPVPGIPSSYNRITWMDENGDVKRETIQDRIFQTIMGGIALFSATGQRPSFDKAFSPPMGLAYAATLEYFAKDGLRQ
jgi:hypothetical protein